MTTLGEQFRLAAQSTVVEFSIGNYSYKYGSTYDTGPGSVTENAVSVEDIPAAQYGLTDIQKANKTYPKNVTNVVMSGIDLNGIVPKTGGVIIFPDLSEHIITEIDGDQYEAAYFMLVKARANVVP